MTAIYGGLFKLTSGKGDDKGGVVVPDLAQDYTISGDGLTLDIKLRKGVKFQDGTDFNAEAVVFNLKRAVGSACACAPKWSLQPGDSIAAVDDLTVAIRFTERPVSVINSFLGSNANWIASPTAVAKLGDAFSVTPVGAGPFKVVKNESDSELVLEANKGYWAKGLPYLDGITYKPIEDPQVSYQAILAGQADAMIGADGSSLVDLARENRDLSFMSNPPTSPMAVQLNTKKGPFADKKAREAIYYATNVDAINKGLFEGAYKASQMFTAPGGLFYHEEIPGYRTYDLKKAKALVKELGGLKVTLGTIASPNAQNVMTVLQAQWAEAGIDVNVVAYAVPALLKQYEVGEWDAMLRVVGGWDPAAGVGVSGYFSSQGRYSGVADPALDDLLRSAGTAVDSKDRDALYYKAGKLISDEAYAPFLFAYAPATVAKGVHGPGITVPVPPIINNSPVTWDQIWMDAGTR